MVREKGGDIRESTKVTGFRLDGDRVDAVATDQGEFTARDIVFALGSWSPLVGKQLDLRIPIQPGKGYSITYTRPSIAPVIPMTFKERAVCVTAWSSGYRLGSTRNSPATMIAQPHATRRVAARRGGISARAGRPVGHRRMVRLASDDVRRSAAARPAIAREESGDGDGPRHARRHHVGGDRGTGQPDDLRREPRPSM